MHYDTGLFHRINKNFNTRWSLYYIDVDNYIVANSGDSHHTASSYAYNIDKVSFYGFEAEFDFTLFENLTIFGNYTYRKTDYDSEDVLGDAILLELSPKHKANLSIRYRWFKKTLLTSDIRYMGERETEGDLYTLDDFITVDVGIEQKLFKKISVRAYAVNIFGEKYQEIHGYPMSDHIYGVNVKMTFF